MLGLGLGPVLGRCVGGSGFGVLESGSTVGLNCNPCGFGWLQSLTCGRSRLVDPGLGLDVAIPWCSSWSWTWPWSPFTLASTAVGGTLPPTGWIGWALSASCQKDVHARTIYPLALKQELSCISASDINRRSHFSLLAVVFPVRILPSPTQHISSWYSRLTSRRGIPGSP